MNKKEVLDLVDRMIKVKELKLDILIEAFEHQERNNFPSATMIRGEIKEAHSDIRRYKRLRELLND